VTEIVWTPSTSWIVTGTSVPSSKRTVNRPARPLPRKRPPGFW
jgi:hypothetical protein